MKLSIAMATLNGEKYLNEQLDSFLYQTKRPDELVVSDDGSADATLDILESFARRVSFAVRIHKNEHRLGYAKNFESAIERCTGDIIFLSDQDDVWYPKKIETMAHVFLNDPTVWVLINDSEITNEHLQSTGRSKIAQTTSLGLNLDNFVTGCCTAIRKEMIPLVCPIPAVGYAHDTWIHALATVIGIRRILPNVLQYYRRHGRNTSQWLGNTTEQVGRSDIMLAYARQSSREWCQLRLAQLEAIEVRIRSALGVGTLSLPIDRFESALRETIAVRRSVTSRLHLLRQGRLARVMPACRMLISGDYNRFSGWKSFAKDILLP